jgi:hypothetical protein
MQITVRQRMMAVALVLAATAALVWTGLALVGDLANCGGPACVVNFRG